MRSTTGQFVIMWLAGLGGLGGVLLTPARSLKGHWRPSPL
jgi:hypothetical protein